MEKEYRIKGVEKILEKVSKEDLAKSFDVDIDADFEKIITQSLKRRGIPNNSEIALYVAITPKELKEMRTERKSTNPQDIAAEFYKNDERQRAMYGFGYNLTAQEYDDKYELIKGTYGNLLFFAVDNPINEAELRRIITPPNHFVGGVHYNGLLMGNKFYEEHREELEEYSPKRDRIDAVDGYIKNFINEFENVEYTGGYGPRPEYTETDEIREKKQESEKIILNLTGKSSIDELSLRDFIQLKRRLEQEEKDLRTAFKEKFTKKDEETKEQ